MTFLAPLLASGGDRRIQVVRGSNVNIYGASPFPRAMLGYAASTANDISLDAFTHLERLVAALPADALHDPGCYAAMLEDLRARLRRAFGLAQDVDVVFGPSGTDLEYVPLALAAQSGAKSTRPVTNVLLGADEVGSGCALACGGRYFAPETAVLHEAPLGQQVPGIPETQVVSVALRDDAGAARSEADVAQAIAEAAAAALAKGHKVLAHVVHGSKTGLVRPDLSGLDRLRDAFGGQILFVVDACQVRLEPEDIRAYLARDCVVLLTGSKFVGGPPFSGFALVPPSLRPARALPDGLASIFRRAEWPVRWQSCDALPVAANPGLFLRLAAAVFEIERFGGIPGEQRARVIGAFGDAVGSLVERLGARLVEPSPGGHAAQGSTLATLDLTPLPGSPDLAVAQRWQRVLAARGVRLGQPVRCVKLPDGAWGATLRVSLSMPLIAELSQLDAAALPARLARDMARVAQVLEAARLPVVA